MDKSFWMLLLLFLMCFTSVIDPVLEKILVWFLTSNSKNRSIDTAIFIKTKRKRLRIFTKATKVLIGWFIICFLVVNSSNYYCINTIKDFANTHLPTRVSAWMGYFAYGINSIRDFVSMFLSALLGALIGFILTDGIDPLDNWFDKDIIDTYIIEDLDKKIVAYIDENRSSKKIVTCLKDNNHNNLITNFAYVIKQGLGNKQSYSVMDEFEETTNRELDETEKDKIKKVLGKIVVEEYPEPQTEEKIKEAVKGKRDDVDKELDKLLGTNKDIIQDFKNILNNKKEQESQWKNDKIVDEKRKKLYYIIDFGDLFGYKSNLALVLCFTEIEYTANGVRKDYTPYVYINAVLLNKNPDNKDVCNWSNCNKPIDEEVKHCIDDNTKRKVLWGNVYCVKHQKSITTVRTKLIKKLDNDFSDKERKRCCYDSTKVESMEPFSGITEDLKRLPRTKDYFPFYGIQNFIARKSLGATQNDLDNILNSIYENICKVIDDIKWKANKEPKDEDITELDSNIIVGIMQEWLQKNKAEIKEDKINNSYISFTTNKLSEILPQKDGQSTNLRFYKINAGIYFRCQLSIKLNKTANSNKATSESKTFCKNYNKIKEICKRQENDKGWLNPYEKMFFVKNDLSKEELKDEVNKNMDICFKGIKEFEKNLEKKLEEKEQ